MIHRIYTSYTDIIYTIEHKKKKTWLSQQNVRLRISTKLYSATSANYICIYNNSGPGY